MKLDDSLGLLFGVIAAFAAPFILLRIKRNSRRRKLLSAGLSPEEKEILTRHVSLYRRLPEELKRELEGLVRVFLDEKSFEGCDGLAIDEEMKLVIAAQACVLLLNRKTNYFPKLETILVYPSAYFARAKKKIGSQLIEDEDARLGESWNDGSLVLAWEHVKNEANDLNDGQNVVLHEFAHQLDQEDGGADGAPPLEGRTSYIKWARVLRSEYESLKMKADMGTRDVINAYGATNPAEFFAVATEAFFEKPLTMKTRHPDLYEEFREYYALDPAAWQDASGVSSNLEIGSSLTI